jgi:type IV secretory pathway TrbF-like protein
MTPERPSATRPAGPLPPYQMPPLEDARRQYVELFGSALVLNTYLKIALVCVSLVAVGLVVLNYRTVRSSEQVKPLVIRIDEVGRAQAVHYDALTYRPVGQAPELKYFLSQFVTKHFGRMRSTVKAYYAESLFFLDAGLAEAAVAAHQRDQTIERFLTGTDDEIEIQVRNVALEELTTPPYRAAVDFELIYYGIGSRRERTRETAVAQIQFVLRDQVPNALIPVNPLGLTVTYVRVDRAFR